MSSMDEKEERRKEVVRAKSVGDERVWRKDGAKSKRRGWPEGEVVTQGRRDRG